MDIDSVAFQMDSFTPPPVFGAIKRSLADNLQVSGGLMRYHSAPSSVLAGYLDDDFFPRESGSFTQAEESEFSRFLSDELCVPNSLCNSKPSLPTEESRGYSMANEARTRQHIGQKRMAAQQSSYMGTGCNRSKPDVSRGPLCAIFEHSMDDSSNNFCTPATGTLQNAHVVVGNQNKSDNCSSKPLMPPISNFGQLPHTESNLIRHSSSPADFLSRLVMEECSERPVPHFTGLYTQATVEGMPQDNTKGKHFPLATTGRCETIPPLPANGSSFNGVSNFGKAKDELKVLETGSLESPLGVNKSGLLRQSSSPAGLLSQLSLDAMSSVCEKVSLCSSPGNSSEEDKRERASLFSNQAVGFWDEVGSGAAAFGQRKRGRETEGQMLQGTPMSESLQRYVGEQEASHLNHFSIHTSTSPGSLASMEASLAHSVLCRARAKRGCATHPRSIAERVRRTKISERMRRLQELVPNMEKQTNTAAMLDEAVEYVKLLQRQVQELSENRPKCNGMCHLKGNAVAEE